MPKLDSELRDEVKDYLLRMDATPSERADVWYWVHHGVHYYSNPWYYADETGWPADLITAIRMDEDNYPVIPAP